MTVVAQQTNMFDYGALDTETRIVVQQRTSEIKALMKRAASDIIEIGQKLIEVKAKLGHGNFYDWLSSEFEWTDRTAQRFIAVAERFKSDNLSDLKIAPSALYLLAAPSTPEAARDEAIERAEAGEEISYSTARDIVAEHKPPRICPYCARAYAGNGDEITTCPYCGNAHAYSGLRDTERYGPYPEAPLPFDDTDDRYSTARDRLEVIGNLEPRPVANHQLINVSTNNEWYTPRPFLDAAHEVMGGIDLDPASNALANEAVRAEAYYTIDEDGYAQPWEGRVWLNPPYGTQDGESNQARWSHRLIDEYRAGSVNEAILLVNAVPGNGWFAPLKDYPICFPDGRIRFYNADVEAGQPTHSNALVYFGSNVAQFVRVFSRFGAVMARLIECDGHISIHGVEAHYDNV